eukprot:47528_1
MFHRNCIRMLHPRISIRINTWILSSNSFRPTSSKATYFNEESAFDPLKAKFDQRMHKVHGSMDAIHLSNSDQAQLMPGDNMAAVLNKALEVEIYPMERPSIIEPWEVLLNVDHTGICGSDLEYYKHGVIGPFELKQPMIMGHESGGTVLAVGNAVNNVQPGDKVALEPGLVCGECASCKAQKYNLCPEVTFFATPPVHGTMRKYMKHHFKYCYKIPNEMSTEEAAWCEPLSVGIHTGGNIANIQKGATVAIFGAGPIGIINLLTSIGYGAKQIVITDINDDKLRMVNEYIANNPSLAGCKVLTRNTMTNPITTEFIGDIGLCDHALECVGNAKVLVDALNMTKSGGTVTVIGMAADSNMNIDISNVNVEEKTLNGVFRYRYTYERAIDMISTGKIGDVKQLITHRANPWDRKELEQALNMLDPKVQLESGTTHMKIMYDMNQ